MLFAGVLGAGVTGAGAADQPPVTRDAHYRRACAALYPWTPTAIPRARRQFDRTDRPRRWRRAVDVRLIQIAHIGDRASRDRALYEFRFEYCAPENTET